jgi:(E)-4-hydroxy-3-methylbut-2-enyl-diphosphate synthase
MATGAVPASFSGLQMKESGLGFGKSMDFVRICDIKRIKSGRKKISMIRNSNTGRDIVELQPASEGSSLLGTKTNHHMYCMIPIF